MSVDKPFWSFKAFTGWDYKYRERWERDNPNLKEELMMIAYNIDPFMGKLTFANSHEERMRTGMFGSQNSWYFYKRYINYTGQGIYNSWNVLLHPTGENPDRPYAQPHQIFEVLMP